MKPRILVIDDNANWREALSEWLHGKGFVVETVGDARQALKLLAGHTDLVVLCDFNMPAMDGLQFLRLARLLTENLVAVMLSSEDDRKLAARARGAGARAFFSKTAAPCSLLQDILSFLERSMKERQKKSLEPWQRLLPGPRCA